MKSSRILLLLVACLMTCHSLYAKEPQTMWIMLTGGSVERCWWTVEKLRPFTNEEMGKYAGVATLNKLLLGTFYRCPMAVDAETVQPKVQGAIEITKEEDLQTTVEHLLPALFEGKDVRLRLELPLESAFPKTFPALPWEFPAFVDEPKLVKVVSSPTNHRLLAKLVQQMVTQWQMTVGTKPSTSIVEDADPKTLVPILENLLKESISGIAVSYSSELDTFFFSVPSTLDKDFYEICQSMLSH